MFSERLSGIYTALEEKYYALLDGLDKRGVPVYSYNDFLEGKGLPAFPVTVALIVLVVAALYGLVFVGGSVNPSFTVEFADQFGEPVTNVTVSVEDSAGNLLRSPDSVSNGGTISLEGIPLGAELVLVAEKSGFKRAELAVPVSGQSTSVTLSMEKDITAINATVQILDSKTSDPVKDALVKAEWQTLTKSGTTNSQGEFELAGIPGGTEILVTVQADGYETSKENYTFLDNETKEISLAANSASFQGSTKVVVSVEDEEGNPVEDAKIVLLDNANDTSIDERTIEGSEAVFTVSKGTSVRLMAEKDGFLKYDSLDFGETRTMRLDEELWPVILAKGGTRLIVSAFAGQSPLSDVEVELYDLNGNLKDSDVTGFGGTAEFGSLGPEEFFVTGYRQGYLPAREKVDLAGTERVSLEMEAADQTNSSYLGISVLDSYKAGAANANLKFFERAQGIEVPLGVPSLQTDLTGYASVIARPGTVVVVEAEKDLQTGSGEKTVEANKDNQLVIELSKPLNVVELLVLDEEGDPAAGNLSIESVSGTPLFDDTVDDGKAFFDSEGNKDIIVWFETSDGKTYSQRLSIEGKETVQVNLGEAAEGIAPSIEFTGVFNELGEKTEGLVKGKDYWLGFQASFPEGVERGGFHIRAGPDSVAFVDSQAAGITGFEAATTDFFYGKSFQPLPSPGSETADMQNTGSGGSFNKFLELYFEEPASTVAFMVKVNVRELSQDQEVEVRYRGWSEAGGRIFRAPSDEELGEQSFTEEKTGLYAATENVTVKVYSSEAACENDLCGNYYFVLPSGVYVDRQEFVAVTDDLYALQVELGAKKPLNVTLKFDTDKASPKIGFTGYDVDEFVDQAQAEETGEIDLSGQGYLELGEGSLESQSSENPLEFSSGSGSASLTVSGLGVSPERSRKVRVYFRAIEEGKAEIKMQAASESVINEEFAFQVERNRELQVSISPREIIQGQPFTVRILDGEDGTALKEATVQIKDSSGKIVKSLVGRGSTRKGLNGDYYFEELEPGVYTASIHVAGYKSLEQEFSIVAQNLLSVDRTITIDIPKGAGEQTKSFSLSGAGKAFSGISYQLEKDAGFPEEMAVSVTLPQSIAAGQDLTGSIRAIVNLEEDSDERLAGEADLILKGNLEGITPTKTVIRLKINYNRELDEDCLYIEKGQLQIRMLGRAGSTASEEVEVENRCDTALTLRPDVEALQEDPNIQVTVPTLRIEKDGVEKLKITASNSIERLYDVYSKRDFRIKLESDQLSKTVPLTVTIDNPQFNLSYPPSVALWMVRNAADERAYAEVPFQVINNGPVPVTGLRIAITPEAYMQGITAGIKPYEVQGINLYPSSPLTPQRYVYAQSSKTEALEKPGQGWIEFFGTVEGSQRQLGRASLSVNYSGTKCLQAEAVDSMVFSSADVSQGTLERKINVTNQCGEPVKLTGSIKPKMVSGNTFVSSPPNVILNNGESQEFKLILVKGQETKRTAAVKVVGLLTRQNQEIESNEISVTLKLGEEAATADGKAGRTVEISQCDGTTTNIAFPSLSEDCSEGYCDTKQLAEYLAKEAEKAAKSARDKIKAADSRIEGLGSCTQKGYCSFEQMGILTDRFPVFLQLDFMTDEALKEALQKTSELKGYDVVQGSKAVADIGEVGFSIGNVYLGGNFKGCGKYYVTIDGAAMVDETGEIRIESQKPFMVIINVESRKTTDECTHNIQNVSNFLPVDEGFTKLENRHAWPGLVEADPEFEKLANTFAKELFGTAEGRTGTNISATSNRLKIAKGSLETGDLLKISIEKKGGSDSPKTVTVYVPSHYSSDNAELTEALTKAFATFKAGDFGKGDCLGEDNDGKFVIMRGFKDLEKLYGKLEVSGEKEMRISNGESCLDLSITSKVPEKATFEISLKGRASPGIEEITLVTREGRPLATMKANQDRSQPGRELQLVKDNKPGSEQFKGEFRLCIKGDERFSLAAQNLESIRVTATGSAGTTGRRASHEVAVEACGMHPYDLVKKMGQVTRADIEKEQDKKYTAYATVSWAGEYDSVDIKTIQRSVAAEAAIDEAAKRYGTGENIPVAEQPAYINQIAVRRAEGIVAYATACIGTSVALSFLNFGLGFADVALDCGVPAMYALGKLAKDTPGMPRETIDTMEGFIRRLIPFVSDEVTPYGETPSEAVAQEQAQDYWDNIGTPAIFGVSSDAIMLAVTNGGAAITEASADIAAKQAAKTAFDNLRKTTFAGVIDPAVVADIGGIESKFAETIKNNILQAHAANPQNVKVLNDAVLPAVQASYTKTGEEVADVIIRNADKFGGASKSAFKGIRQSAIDNLFNETQIVEHGKLGITAGDLELPEKGTKYTATELDNFTNGVVQKMKRNIISELEDQSPAFRDALSDATFKSGVETKIEEGLKNSLKAQATYDGQTIASRGTFKTVKKYGAKISQNNLDDASRSAFVKVKRELGDEIVEKVVNKKVGGEFVEALMKGEKGFIGVADDLVDPAKATRWSRLKTAVKQARRFFNLDMVKGMAKGIAGGAISNWVGYLAWDYYWEKYGDQPVPGAETAVVRTGECVDTDGDGQCNDPVNGIDDDKDGLIDEDIFWLAKQVLERGHTYRIDITADVDGKLYSFSEIKDEEGFRAMKKEIADKEAVLWEEEGCKNFLEKPVTRYLGNLAPVPTKDVEPRNVIAYYNYNDAFARQAAGIQAEPGDDLPEDWLAAVLFVEPERLKCDGVSAEWFRRAEGEGTEAAQRRAVLALECAGKKLRSAISSAGAGSSFRKLAETISAGQDGTDRYVELVVQVQKRWEKFRILNKTA